MTPELLLLLAASLVAMQMVALLLRREHRDAAPYLGLLAVDLVVLGVQHGTGRHDSMLSFVAEAAALVLTVVPRLLEGVERRAIFGDRLRRAIAAAMARELLVPGAGSTRRRRHLQQLAATRSGQVREVVRKLRAELEAVKDPSQATALHEEVATVLFLSQRFDEAIEEVEAHLGADPAALRPTLLAYLIRAYAEKGRLDEAAGALHALEEGPAAHDPAGTLLLLQCRLTFLAFAAPPEVVERALGGEAAVLLPLRARVFLLEAARGMSREPVSAEVAAYAVEVAGRVAQEAIRVHPVGRRGAPVTIALVLANFVAYAAVLWAGGIDEATLVRAGALFRPAVFAGEWWRAVTAMFLHAGWIHLGVNMYGLYLLGRFTEEIVGSPRYLLIYLLAGVAGAAASASVSLGALSVGASGAIMGLLGALIVMLVLRRGAWPEAWRRALLWNLLFLGALQIYIGFQVPMIDNAAHIGGMVGGAAATLVVAPGGLLGQGRWVRRLLTAAAGLAAAAVLMAGGLAATTPLDATLGRVETREVVLGGRVRLTLPSYWEVDEAGGRAADPFFEVQLITVVTEGGIELASPQDGDLRYRALLTRIRSSARVLDSPGAVRPK